jgi:putative ABC transport system ATP-binding protein
MQAAISVSDIHLTLGEGPSRVPVLRGVTLAIRPGETVAILGPSGSGKSTLMAVVAGLEAPDRGEVTIAGSRITGLSEDALAQFRGRHIGIVFQSFNLIPTMTALENVAVPLELAGRGDAFVIAEAELQAVGLGERTSHLPTRLSGGEQQRVAIARALAPSPPLLVADEPTGNLDATTGTAIMDLLLQRAAEKGTTLVVVTHDEALARRFNRQIRLADGQIIADTSATIAEAA